MLKRIFLLILLLASMTVIGCSKDSGTPSSDVTIVPPVVEVPPAPSQPQQTIVKIAIIDTGFDSRLFHGPALKLCDTGHFDFSKGTTTIGHNLSHGTYVAEVVANNLRNMNYCVIIYTISEYQNAEQIISAFYKAASEGVTAINASYSGTIFSLAEREAIRDAAKSVPAIFVAAGNDGRNLDSRCIVYPACFDIANMFSVGALDRSGHIADYSNYGTKVKLWYNGKGPNGHLYGTSFATPRALSDYILHRVLSTRPQPKMQSKKRYLQLTSTHT